ncbi:hypothetical protein R3P38DRAFT_3205102 [Favolaschia claudopus]|uniref:Uncharacterized protein n=1 Tax=Favolaschia claudopus TaxID=2862362 RepID=A0AAW0AP97_9AGAR
MAYATSWVEAMAREDWGDSTDRYVENRNGKKPEIRIREIHSERFDDALDNYSVSSSGDHEPDTAMQVDGGVDRRIIGYPIRQATPPPFRRDLQRGEHMEEVMDRRGDWLNTFVDWGRRSTYSSSLWGLPLDGGWNPNVLERGYLLLSEGAEFRLRYQVIANPSIRFPRHVLEVALERWISFIIAYKRADCDLFRPKKSDLDYSPGVSKALVDLRAKGPKIALSPSVNTLYLEYKHILGKLADLPQARALILRGGATSWIMRAYVGMGLVNRALSGPSVQVTVFHAGANDTGDDDALDVTWDAVSEGDLESVYGYIPGATHEQDRYLYPTNEILEEFSDHHYGEWNPFCEETFKKIKTELDNQRGRPMSRGDWKKFFQLSNRGERRPKVVAKQDLIEEGMARLKGALSIEGWNKRRIMDIGRDLPHQFQADF